MSRPRLSILGLIAGDVASGVVLAALRSGSDYWVSAFYTMTVALLLGAVVAARYRRGISRAFWFGFAVFGWGGLLLTSNPWTPQGGLPREGFGADLNRNLMTTRVIQFFVVHLRMGTDDLQEIDGITANTIGIVALLLVLAVATVGGLLAVAMKKRARKLADADSSQRPSVVPSLVILVGLALASLSAFDRPAPTYFVDTETQPDGIGAFKGGWYSEALRAAGEPALGLLASQNRAATVYRFLWLPFRHHPVTVRVVKTGKGARLDAIVLDGFGGYGPGHVAIAKTVELSENQWRELERRLESTAFWEMATRTPYESKNDGAQYVIEGVKSGRYHVVDRGDHDPAYTALCRYMLDLTSLKTQKTWEGYHQIESNPESPSPAL